MIDVHCHILPQVDDGARNWEEAVDMAHQAARQGITDIIATPHFMEGVYQPQADEISRLVNILNGQLQAVSCPVRVWPGAEVYLHPDLARWCERGLVKTLGVRGAHLLVELPRDSLPLYAERVLFELSVLGITPIIAHPERQRRLSQDCSLVATWVDRGVWMQLNTQSFTGAYGRRTQEAAHHLVSQGLIHCLGSDSHTGAQLASVREARRQLQHRAGDRLRELDQLSSSLLLPAPG